MSYPSSPAAAQFAPATRETLELDGEWQFRLDPKNEGKSQSWANDLGETTAIEVGRPWEYWHPNYDGVAWYQKEIAIPAGWQGKAIRMCFEAVSYYCDVWLNGQPLGSHEGGFTPFEFDAAPAAKYGGRNVLTVRVINPPANYEVDGFRSGAPLNQSDLPIGKSAWYYNFGGIWQGVRLMAVPARSVTAVRIFPEIAKDVIHVEVDLACPRDGANDLPLKLEIFAADKDRATISESRTVSIGVGQSTHRLQMPLGELARWTMDSPTLHRLRVTTPDGDGVEAVFGVREFTFEGKRFLINGEPVVLKGFLQQGMYPRTLVVPETREDAVKELRLLKDGGFNFIRIHLKPAPPWYLDLTDEIGLLVMHEPPMGWIANSPKTRERCLREVRDLLLRDANHPSIISWCLFNESFHLLGFTPVQAYELSIDASHLARELDPSRLIINVSAGDAKTIAGGVDTMIHDTSLEKRTASALRPWTQEITPIYDDHVYCANPVGNTTVERYRTLDAGELAMFISEYGAPETPPDFAAVLSEYTPEEATRGLEDWTLHRDFLTSLEGHLAKSGLGMDAPEFIRQVNRERAADTRTITVAMRMNPDIGGYCFCQLADASGELFGATDVWRRPKPLYHALCEAVANPALDVSLLPRDNRVGEPLAVRCYLACEENFTCGGTLTLEIVNSKGEAAWKQTIDVPRAVGARIPFQGQVSVELSAGDYELRASLNDAGKEIAKHGIRFHHIPAPEPYAGPIGLREEGMALAKFFSSSSEIITYGNNFRQKDDPIFLDVDPVPAHRMFFPELYGQLRKIVELGGCAVLFRAEAALLYQWLFPTHIRPQGVMRTCGYTLDHPVFAGLPCGGVTGADYAEIINERYDSAEDVLAADGEILYGAFSMNMWTRPAAYWWAAGLYRVPIGRGNVIVCHLDLPGKADTSPLAAHLLNNLARYAKSLIRTGGMEYLDSRCIDPLPAGAPVK